MSMDIRMRNARIANSYYNLGLEKAKMRDLSGAAQALKDSLHFDKYQTDARNLLGLIYYESGEVSDALVQWVISLSLQPENNLADHYLDEIQRKPGQLEVESANVRTYNQALMHAKSGSDDLAILQLARVVEAKPHFIKAHLLLAVLYLAREDYRKAGRSLYKILQIDKSNSKALYYMEIVKQKMGKLEPERKRYHKAFSHRKMEDDDVLMPPTYRETTGVSTIIHILIGLLLGVAAFYFLVLPASEKALNIRHNQELTTYLQKLNSANQEYESLKSQYDSLEASGQQVQERLDELESGNTSVMGQYQRMILVLQAYRAGDLVSAANTFADGDYSLITDPNLTAIVEDVRNDLQNNVSKTLVSQGMELWSAGNSSQALTYFQASLRVNPQNPEAMFYVARIYQNSGDTENANALFDQIVGEYPDSEYAPRAQQARGY